MSDIKAKAPESLQTIKDYIDERDGIAQGLFSNLFARIEALEKFVQIQDADIRGLSDRIDATENDIRDLERTTRDLEIAQIP